MAIFQRTLTAAVAAAALAGTFAIQVHAQPAQPQAATATAAPAEVQPRFRGQPADFAKLHAERTERLKTILQIQPNQEAAWDKYVKAITPEPRSQARAERPDLRTLTTPERLDLKQKLRKERMAKAEQREGATRSFYGSLNPSQQKAFDAMGAERRGMHKPGHGQRFDHKRGPHHGHGPAGLRTAPPAPAV